MLRERFLALLPIGLVPYPFFFRKDPALLAIKLVCLWFLRLAKQIVKWWDMASYLTRRRVPGGSPLYGLYWYVHSQRVSFSAVWSWIEYNYQLYSAVGPLVSERSAKNHGIQCHDAQGNVNEFPHNIVKVVQWSITGTTHEKLTSICQITPLYNANCKFTIILFKAYTLPCMSPVLVRVHDPSLSHLFSKPEQSRTN